MLEAIDGVVDSGDVTVIDPDPAVPGWRFYRIRLIETEPRP